MGLRALVAVTALGAASPAHADTCEAAEVESLRAHLSEQSSKANKWNWAWRITFTTAAVGTASVGAWNPAPSLQAGLYASAGKASIGALARFILPLNIEVPEATGDACTDLAALRKEVRRVARRERSLFWTGHIGGALVNLGGAIYVYTYDGTGKALLSVAIGYPVGLLSNYTMPRATWKLWRERESTWNLAAVTAVPRDDGWVLSLSGTF
jgi:hypothetical protein